MLRTTTLRLAALGITTLAAAWSPLGAQTPRELYDGDLTKLRILVNRDGEGLALQGYDPVAYFTENRPVAGDPRHRIRYKGAIYQFSSTEHREAFEADPARYEPAFGGYCGYAASIDKLSPISPEFFQILDGRLVLQHNRRAWDLWNGDVQGNLVKADANWPGLVEENGSGGRVLVNLDGGVALHGFDPMAYHLENRPLAGDPSIEAVYDGARYHFASKANKDLFEASPARYAPAFGGFCAAAASRNELADVDPAVFRIAGGRLLLQSDPETARKFDRKLERNLAKADRHWPELLEKHGK